MSDRRYRDTPLCTAGGVVTGNGEVQVDAAALVSHAGAVDGIGDGLTTAVQAGEAVRTARDHRRQER